MTDEELWNGIVHNLNLYFSHPEFDPRIIEVFEGCFTFELGIADEPMKDCTVWYKIDDMRVVVDWDSLEIDWHTCFTMVFSVN